MANFRENVYNDGKGKSQSYEYRIEISGNAPWYYNAFFFGYRLWREWRRS